MLLASQARNVQDLEALLLRQHRIQLASGLWSRYMRGEVVPQGALANSPSSLVHRIGRVFPKTEFAFQTPLWRLLVWEPAIDPTQLKSIYLSLDDEIHVHFVARIEERGQRIPTELGRFWHLKKTNEGRRAALKRCPDYWIYLMLCLLEARMAYASQNIEAFVDCQVQACQVLSGFQQTPQFQAKRLKGVLLLMEAMCLDALLINVDIPPPINLSHEKARDSSYLAIKGWAHRCLAHIDDLSAGSKKAFVQRLRGGTQVGQLGFFRYL